MAKKKKLNKPVVVLLSILGLAALVGATIFIVQRLPKNPDVYITKGDEACQKKDYAEAERSYMAAIGAAEKQNALKPEYYLKMSRMESEWSKSLLITKTQMVEKYRLAKDLLTKSLRLFPEHIETRRELVDMLWERELGNWNEIIRDASELLKRVPTDDATFFRRAQANSALAVNVGGEFADKALADYRKAIELKKDNVEYRVGLAQFLQKTDPTKTESVLQEALKDNPGSTELRIAYSEYLNDAKRPDEAMKQLDEAAKRQPASALPYLAKARIYIGRNEMDPALAALATAKANDPLDYRSYRDQAAILVRRGKPQEAIAALREGLKVLSAKATSAPGTAANSKEAVQQELGRADLNYVLASSLIEMAASASADTSKPTSGSAKNQPTSAPDRDKLIQEARATLEQITGASPAIASLKAKLGGRLAMIENKPDQARQLLEQAWQTKESFDGELGLWLLMVYVQQQQTGKAEALLEQFRNLPGSANNPTTHLIIADIKLRFGAYEEAGKEAKIVLGLQPDNEAAKIIYNIVEAGQSGVLSKEIKMTPQIASQLLRLSMRMASEDRLKQAIRLLEDVHQRQPDNLDVVERLANYYMADKADNKAKALLQETQAKNKDNPAVARNVAVLNETDPQKRLELILAGADSIQDPVDKALEKARICVTQGQVERAKTFVKEAQQINPKSPGVLDWRFILATGDKEKDWATAEEVVTLSAEVNKNLSRVYKARIHYLKGEYDAAIALLNDLLAEMPDAKNSRSMLGDCYMMTHNYGKAEEAYRAVYDADPYYAPAVVGLARVTEALSRWNEHQGYIEKAYVLTPRDEYVAQRYLKVQDERLTPDQAIAKREEWRAQNPDDLQNVLRLATLYESNKRLDKAQSAFQYVYEKTGRALDGAEMMLNFYFRTNNSTEIERLLTQIANSPADKIGAWILYGNVRQQQGQLEQARTAFTQAMDEGVKAKDPRGCYAMAMFRARQNQWPEAIEAMKKYVAIKPGPASEKAMAKFYIDGKQFDDALKTLDAVLAAAPDDAEALSDKAAVLMLQDKYAQAEEMLSKVLKNQPDNYAAALRRAAIYVSRNQSAQAREDIKTARKNAASVDDLMQAANLSLRLHDDDVAAEIYRDVTSKNPDYAPAWLELAKVYLSNKDWDRFDPLVVQAQRKFPQRTDFIQIAAYAAKARGQVDSQVRLLEQAFGISKERPVVLDYIGALLDAKEAPKALALAAEYADKPGMGGLVKSLQARAMIMQRQTTQGDELFKMVLRNIDPNELRFFLDQIEKAYGPKDGADKIESWSMAWPSDWRFRTGLSDWYLRTELKVNQTRALELLTKAYSLATQPADKAEIQTMMAIAYQKTGNVAKALEAYLAALAIMPNDARTLNNLAYLYANDLEKPKDALPYAEKAAQLMPKSPDVLDTYGWTLIKLGQYGQASDILQRAVFLEGASPATTYHMGYLYEKQNLPDQALAQYKSALQMLKNRQDDPFYKTLQEAINRLPSKK